MLQHLENTAQKMYVLSLSLLYSHHVCGQGFFFITSSCSGLWGHVLEMKSEIIVGVDKF